MQLLCHSDHRSCFLREGNREERIPTLILDPAVISMYPLRASSAASTSQLRSVVRPFCTCPVRFTERSRNTIRNRNPNMATKFLRTSKPLKASYPPTELHIAVKDMSAITSRPTLINEDTCRDLVRAWGIDKIHDAVIIEPYAGTAPLRSLFRR